MLRLFTGVLVRLLYKMKSKWPMLLEILLDDSILRGIRLHFMYYLKHSKGRDWGADTVGFFDRNAERVNAVAETLADEKSKKIYTGIIKYRQTRDKKDFPFYAVKERQYFIKELTLGKNETYIDCGASGTSIDWFLRKCPKYKQIIAFEPDCRLFEILRKRFGNNPRIKLINAGVSDKNDKAAFSTHGDGTSHMIADGNRDNLISSVIQTETIDGLDLERVSFIKMDIEGAELNALKGAEKTILRDKPKLAICIYHSLEDMIGIAEYIHKLVPEYKLYVRQYDFVTETVLYAVCRSA
jgi:FkbM family methyltransferase